MQPKCLIVFINSDFVLNKFCAELSSVPQLKYNVSKFNGEYRVIFKCSNYYSSLGCRHFESFYNDYIYVYGTISILLSDFLISHYEAKLVDRIIKNQYFYFPDFICKQINNISTLLLDDKSPVCDVNELFLLRKEKLLNTLLRNFRNKNFLYLDSFINFSCQDYMYILEDVVSASVSVLVNDSSYSQVLKFILQNFLL